MSSQKSELLNMIKSLSNQTQSVNKRLQSIEVRTSKFSQRMTNIEKEWNLMKYDRVVVNDRIDHNAEIDDTHLRTFMHFDENNEHKSLQNTHSASLTEQRNIRRMNNKTTLFLSGSTKRRIDMLAAMITATNFWWDIGKNNIK